LSSIILLGGNGGQDERSASLAADSVPRYIEYIGGGVHEACEDQPSEAPSIPYIEEYGRYSILPIPMPESVPVRVVADGQMPHDTEYKPLLEMLQAQLLEISSLSLLTCSLQGPSDLQAPHSSH
jgi:hypothetical protein